MRLKLYLDASSVHSDKGRNIMVGESIIIRARLTPDEKATLRKASAESRQSMAAWIGVSIVQRLKREGYMDAETQAAHEEQP